MMVQQNGWSSLFLIPFVLLSGELFKFLEFAKLFPSVYLNLLSIGVASAVGQLFLFNMVSSPTLQTLQSLICISGVRIWTFTSVSRHHHT